jgi:hypothetical protein
MNRNYWDEWLYFKFWVFNVHQISVCGVFTEISFLPAEFQCYHSMSKNHKTYLISYMVDRAAFSPGNL